MALDWPKEFLILISRLNSIRFNSQAGQEIAHVVPRNLLFTDKKIADFI